MSLHTRPTDGAKLKEKATMQRQTRYRAAAVAGFGLSALCLAATLRLGGSPTTFALGLAGFCAGAFALIGAILAKVNEN